MPAQATLEAFKARLRGELLQANDAATRRLARSIMA